MKTQTLFPIAGAWLLSLGAAYYLGQSGSISEESETELTSATKPVAKRTALRPLAPAQPNSPISLDKAAYSPHVYTQTSGGGPVMNIEAIKRISDPLERSRQLLRLIDSYSTADYTAALTLYSARNLDAEESSERALLLTAWAKLDPLAALEYTQSSNDSVTSTQQVIASWAAVDPEAALDWARANHSEDSANPWLTGVIRGIASSNTTRATAILQELPFSQERGNALNAIIPYIAEQGITNATTWLEGISDERLRQGATRFLATHLAQNNPADASAWVSSIEDDSQRTSAIAQVMNSWANQDPEAAKEWLESLPESDQSAAEPHYIGQLAAQDPNSAADWLDARGDAENYQELLQKFASSSIAADPVIALNYGNEIENESTRSRTVSRALWTLYRQDKESAREWIRNNELPERVQRRVNRMMEN